VVRARGLREAQVERAALALALGVERANDLQPRRVAERKLAGAGLTIAALVGGNLLARSPRRARLRTPDPRPEPAVAIVR
jgi:hypothetical protein